MKLKTGRTFIQYSQNMYENDVVDTYTNMRYLILNCDTDYLSRDDHVKRLYNSVILDPYSRAIISLGSPIAYEIHAFNELYPNDNYANDDDEIIIEEMIEGISVQMFYDYRIRKWGIAIRDFEVHTGTKSYRDMFYDALGCDIETKTGSDTLNEWNGITYMDKKCCYHFTLQHPDNHIVFNNIKPRLYFTGFYHLYIDGIATNVSYVCSQATPVFPEYLNIKIPRVAVSKNPFTYEKNITEYTSIHSDLISMGIYFLHKRSGRRAGVLHARYKDLQELRKINACILFQYICLRRISKVRQFLKHFPQYKKSFWKCFQLYESMIILLHKTYFDRYIKKVNNQIHNKLLYHINQLHNTVFKPSLQETKTKIISKMVVQTYIQRLEPGCILHLLQHAIYISE